ncbi:uncharacterized protein LOC108024909 [Drosophila biarmipes]|uniref:uncharacterized protein LOC108024909 n=1 Tax=Drosophila biarmipes TaxID=125945 RepID=UPI0021CCB5FE|nr:uncharacterized protein LOC108024909 [Drosophila biarmipes]
MSDWYPKILDEITFNEYAHKRSPLNKDDNTKMSERDMDSTFLLPHTHLYKPDEIPHEFAGLRST